jgi:hypothetical protein
MSADEFHFTGVLQIIADVGWEHVTTNLERDDGSKAVTLCDLSYTLRAGKWTRWVRTVGKLCRRVIKCPTCERRMTVAQGLVFMGLSIQRVALPVVLPCFCDAVGDGPCPRHPNPNVAACPHGQYADTECYPCIRAGT